MPPTDVGKGEPVPDIDTVRGEKFCPVPEKRVFPALLPERVFGKDAVKELPRVLLEGVLLGFIAVVTTVGLELILGVKDEGRTETGGWVVTEIGFVPDPALCVGGDNKSPVVCTVGAESESATVVGSLLCNGELEVSVPPAERISMPAPVPSEFVPSA
jgi:hypothetical protein